MSPPSLRSQAIALRQSGKSYREILLELNIPKSTLATWFKGVQFSEEARLQNISGTKQRWAEVIREFNAKRKATYLEQTRKQHEFYAAQVPEPDSLNLFFLFMGIFWGEGSKRSPSSLRISNSDPAVIRMCIQFLTNYCGVEMCEFQPRVHLHKNLNPTAAVRYWSQVTGIDPYLIATQLVVSSASKNKKPIHTLPYGTFNLVVQNTKLLRKVKGWLYGIESMYMPK